MPKLTVGELAKIRERARKITVDRHVVVHMGTCGIAAGAQEVLDALHDEIAKQGAQGVVVTTSGCAGLCSREPMATVVLKGRAPVKYVDLNPEKIQRILVDHVLGGQIVTEYALAVGCETIA
jgi:NADP-reducing hydrogenase subunit HndB